jgi:hypothetical protein
MKTVKLEITLNEYRTLLLAFVEAGKHLRALIDSALAAQRNGGDPERILSEDGVMTLPLVRECLGEINSLDRRLRAKYGEPGVFD